LRFQILDKWGGVRESAGVGQEPSFRTGSEEDAFNSKVKMQNSKLKTNGRSPSSGQASPYPSWEVSVQVYDFSRVVTFLQVFHRFFTAFLSWKGLISRRLQPMRGIKYFGAN
jgi:hypothetical protein